MKTCRFWTLIQLITIVFFVSLISGCASKVEKPVKTIHVYKHKVVKIPVLPEKPDVHCDFNKEGSSLVGNLLECIAILKVALNQVTRNPVTDVDVNNGNFETTVTKDEFLILPGEVEDTKRTTDENNVVETPG